jgi:DhnA family fructose-bisphosphate aldolase class Ia
MSIFPADQKALVLAMDHAQTHGVIAGLEDPGRVIDAAVEAGVDAIMTTFGVVKKYKDKLIGRVPTILRLDGGPSLYREDWLAYTEFDLIHPVEDALALGVNGVVVMAFVGIPVELQTYRVLGRVASACMRANLPVLVESLPCRSERIPDPNAADAMASAARLAFEHGADLVKVYYTGTVDSFRKVTGNCPVPALIAGGPKMDSDGAGLRVVAGRRVWFLAATSGRTRICRG